MGQLTNLYVSESYQGLLKLANSTTGVTGTLQYVQDGIGNNIPMLVSTSSVVITGSFRGDGSGLTGITATVDTGSLVTTSSFNAFTASIDGRVDALEIETGSLQNQINQKLDTGSFNTYTSSNDAKVNALINATGSYATTSSLTSLSQSIASTDLGQDNRLSSIEGVTGSFATTSSLNSYTLTSSFNSYTSSADGRLSSLESATSSLQNQINQKLDTGSFNTYTSSNDAKVNALIGATGSYATTGSNVFQGNQTISGSLNVTGSINALSASITYLQTVYQTSSVIFTSGSNILGDEASDVQTLNGTVNVPLGNLNVTGATTSSLGFFGNLQGTASFASNALSASQAQNAISSSHSVNSDSSISSSFAQNAISASQAENANLLDGKDSTEFATTGSNTFLGNQTITGSILVSGSANFDVDVNGRIRITGPSTGNTPRLLVSSSAANSFFEANYYTINKPNSNTIQNSTDFGGFVGIVSPVDGTDVGFGLDGTQVTSNWTKGPAFYVNNDPADSYAGVFGFQNKTNYTDGRITLLKNTDISGSLRVTQGITGSLEGTASYATNALSSSHAINADTASFLLGTIASASYAENAGTASFAQDIFVVGKNTTGGLLTKGTVVRIGGATGDQALIVTASWEDDGNSANTLGILAQDIANDASGSVITNGTLLGINTSGFTAGDVLFLSSSGQYTNVVPPAPYHEVRLGQVLRVQQVNGSMYVQIQNGYELSELHDVDIQSVAVGDVLTYVSGSYGQWVNKTGAELGYASTGSNNFIGQQNINGNVNVSGSLIVSGSQLQVQANNGIQITNPADNVSSYNVQIETGSFKKIAMNMFTEKAFIQSSGDMFFFNTWDQNSSGSMYFNSPNQIYLNATSSVYISGSNAIDLKAAQLSVTASLNLSGSQHIVRGNVDLTGSANITGSINVIGSTTIKGNTLNTGSLTVRSGSLNLVGQTTIANHDLLLTSSIGGESNIIQGWGDNPGGGAAASQINYSGSLRITGSNNIFSMPQIRATALGGTADQTGYISGSGNMIMSNNAGIYLNTGSLLFPKIQNNILGVNSVINMTFTTSSLAGGHPIIGNNIAMGGGMTLNHPSGSLNASTNALLGGSITSTQTFVTNIKPTISANNILGSVTINHISGSVSFSNNYVNASTFAINNHVSSSNITNNGVSVTNNVVFGGSGGAAIGIYTSGSQNSNTSRLISDSIIGGRNVTVSSSFVSSSNANLLSSLVVGNGLTVSGSHTAGTNGGSAFLGRFNDTTSLHLAQDVVFAVGTGTGTSNRRTGLYVTSGSLVGVSGSLDVRGNSTFTGSAIMSSSTTFPLYVSGTIQTQRLHFDGNPFNTNPSSNLGAIRIDGSNQTFYSTMYDFAEITSQSLVGQTVITGSNLVKTSLQSSYGGTDAYVDLINSAGTRTLDIKVDAAVITGSLNVSGSATITGSVQGNVNNLTVASNTASLNLNNGNFFELALTGSQDIRIEPSNIKPGQTVNIKLNTTGSGTVSFPTSVKQASGSAYVPTTGTSVDVITMVSFDSTNLYLANVKNLI